MRRAKSKPEVAEGSEIRKGFALGRGFSGAAENCEGALPKSEKLEPV
jgi:hypothetical protein